MRLFFRDRRLPLFNDKSDFQESSAKNRGLQIHRVRVVNRGRVKERLRRIAAAAPAADNVVRIRGRFRFGLPSSRFPTISDLSILCEECHILALSCRQGKSSNELCSSRFFICRDELVVLLVFSFGFLVTASPQGAILRSYARLLA